ncbi:MAG: amidohydrolase family protein [Acidobacteriia bacterium]|nr:amidohydrolase family protein [Terriglobia bacterium]
MIRGTRWTTLLAAGILAAGIAIPNMAQTQAQTRLATVYAITHAKIFTLAGAPIDDGTIIFRDGKIAAVGAKAEIPADAQVIDATGLQAYPGLFDSLSQMGLSEVAAVSSTVDSTETGDFNPDVVAAEAVHPASEHIPVTRAAGITHALAVPGSGGFDSGRDSGVITGQASAIHLAGWTMEEMLISKSVAMGLDWPTIETRTFDLSTFSRKDKPYAEAKKEYEKKLDELADWLERARHYAQALEKGSAARFDRDVKLEALVPVVHGELPVLVFASRARDIRNAVEFCEKQKLRMVLAGGDEAARVKDLLKARGIPVILGPVQNAPAREDDPYDQPMAQPAELSAAGVKIAFASFDNSFARRLGQQAAVAVAYGLPYDEALKAVTLYPAQIFGLDRELGTLEPGKLANLIVTNGDPLELTTELRFLFIKGQLTSLENKHTRLYDKYRNRPKP